VEKIQRILIATDFSPRGERAMQRAAQLASEHAAELYLLHALPALPLEVFKRLIAETPLETEQRLYNRAKIALQNRAEILASKGIRVKHHVAIGRAHVEINRYAQSHHADLIVIGDQGESFARELFLGTTASKTLRTGHHPLLIVRQEPTDRYKHVLVPVDFSKNSLNALEVALKAAANASIQVLHVVEMPLGQKLKQAGYDAERVDHYRDEMLTHAREGMEKIVSDYAQGDARVTSIIEYGRAADTIREKTQALDIDLVVIGKRGQTELDEALFGSVTKHILYETSCDVLVVNP
jgi:nucleotide-binding universal stress UspA family protein